MKNYLLLFCLLTVPSLFSQYEYPSQQDAESVLQKTLAVQLLDDSDEYGKYANEAVKEIFNENWKLTEVAFFTEPEIKQLKKERNSKYAYLVREEGLFEYSFSDDPSNVLSAYTVLGYYVYNLEVFAKKKKPTSVTKVGFATGKLSKVDYLFLSQQLNHLLLSSNKGILASEYYNAESSIAKIKSTQLILLENYFKENDLVNMGSFYEHSYKVVNMDTYEDVVLNKDAGKTYIKIVWSIQHKTYLTVVINAEDGSIVSRLGLGGIKLGKEYKFNDVIKAKHLKYITSKMAQKVNNRYK